MNILRNLEITFPKVLISHGYLKLDFWVTKGGGREKKVVSIFLNLDISFKPKIICIISSYSKIPLKIISFTNSLFSLITCVAHPSNSTE